MRYKCYLNLLTCESVVSVSMHCPDVTFQNLTVLSELPTSSGSQKIQLPRTPGEGLTWTNEHLEVVMVTNK